MNRIYPSSNNCTFTRQADISMDAVKNLCYIGEEPFWHLANGGVTRPFTDDLKRMIEKLLDLKTNDEPYFYSEKDEIMVVKMKDNVAVSAVLISDIEFDTDKEERIKQREKSKEQLQRKVTIARFAIIAVMILIIVLMIVL